MALNIGELVGYIGLDSSGFESGLQSAWAALSDKKWGTAAGAVGLAAGAALTAGLVGAINNDAAVRKMNAGLGLTGPAAERAGQVAGNLYSNAYGESMDQVTEATAAVMASIPGMMDAPAADLEQMTATVLDLANAFDLDLGRAAQVAGQMVSTGLAKDGAEAADLLTASLQRVPPAVREDLVDAVDEYGPFFQALGMSGDEAMSMLVASSEKGMYGIDKTGDALKELTIRASDGSKGTVAAYEAMGLNADEMAAKMVAGGAQSQEGLGQIIDGLLNMEDPAARAQAAVALFGTPLEDLSVTEIPQFLEGLKNAGGGLGDVSGAAARMGEELNGGPAVALETFKRQALASFTGLAAGAIPVLQPVLDFLAQWGHVIGPVVAVLGALAAVVWVVSAAISAFTVIAGAAGAVIAVLTSPITLVIAAIAALVAALWLIVSNWEQISAWLGSAFAAFGAWWSTVWGGLVNGVVAAWASIVGAVQVAWNGMIAWLAGVGAGLATWWTGLWSGLGSLVAGAWTAIVAAVSGAWNGMVGWLQGAGAVLSGWWSAYWGAWGALLSGAWAVITGILSAAWGGAVAAVQAVGAVLSGWWSGLWSGLAAVASALWSAISGAVVGGFRLVLAGLQVVGSTLSGWWSGLWGAVRGAAAAVWSGISATVTGAFRGALSGLQSIGAALSGWWSGLWGAVRGAASAAWSAISSVVLGFFRNMLAGFRIIGAALSSWWSGLWNGVRSFVTSAWSAISSVVLGFFRNMLAGFRIIGSALVSWWSSMWNGVRNLVSSVWEGIRSIISSAFSAVLGVIQDTGSRVVSTLAGAWSRATSGIRGFVDGALGFFRDLPGGIVRALGNVGDLLLGAGRAIIDGFVRGLKQAWEKGKEFVSGIGQWIADNKGPESYDRRLLRPAGRWIMDGLRGSMEDEVPALGRTLAGITGTIEAGVQPQLNVGASAGLGPASAPVGSGPSADDIAYAISAAMPRDELPRELILNVEGRKMRAFVEEVSTDTTRRAADSLASTVRAFTGTE